MQQSQTSLESSTISTFTMPWEAQSTSSPELLALGGAGGPNPELTAGIATGAFLGVMSFVGLIFGVCKCVQNHRDKNAAPSDVEAGSVQTDNISCGGGSVHELDYAEQKDPGLLSSMFSRVCSWFGRNKPNVDVTLLENPVSNGRRSRSHSLGSYNTHNKSPNVDAEQLDLVRRDSSPSLDSNTSNDHSIYEPHVSVVGSGPASSELPEGSGRSSPRI